MNADGWQIETITAAEISALKAKKASSTITLTSDEQAALALGPGSWLYQIPVSTAKSASTAKSKINKPVAPAAKNFLVVNLSIVDDAENNQIANIIKTSWEKIGVKTLITPVDVSDIQGSVVKPKKYEALLFTEQVGADPDVYVFWHSTQAGANGFNLSNYKNENVDNFLEDGLA